MKYYKITLGKDGTRLIYPPSYQSEIGDKALDHLYYDDGITDYLLLVLPDSATGIVRNNVEEITEVEAKTISEAHETRVEKIVDEAKLRRIELKASLGQALTKDEQDSVDITKPNSVFGIEKILTDRIDEKKAKGL